MFELEPKAASVPSVPVDVPINKPELHVADILAAPRRLWLRGCVVDRLAPPERRNWLPRLWGRSSHNNEPRSAQLLTRISNRDITSNVTLSPDGYFEACLPEELPPARRGWRVARNTLTIGDTRVEGCGLVLTSPEQARQAVVVLLPLASTTSGQFAALTTAENAAWTGRMLGHLTETYNGPCPVYYIGCAPLSIDSRQQELALAVRSLGWPGGTLVLLPDTMAAGPDVLVHGLDRLRWLFAGSLSMSVVNLETRLAKVLASDLKSRDDRAEVRLLVNPGDETTAALTVPSGHNGASRQPAFTHRVTRHPLVFCHGMLGISALHMRLPEHLNYYSPLEPFLRERGFRALFPDVPATGGVAERAERLREQIRRWTDEPVNLIAHSMGGLDCRYLITHLGMADRVRSLTTIATPHHGTYLAEWFIRNYRHRVPLLFAMEALGVDMGGFRACLCSSCADFNAKTPDMSGVQYFSYGASVSQAQVNPILRRVWNVLTAAEGANDGMISVASAHWGEYLGTIAVDHFAQTPDALPTPASATFDPLGFYLHIAEDLARRGL